MANQMAATLYRSFWRGMDWLYPPACAGCGLPGSRWCDACQNEVVLASSLSRCYRCGAATANQAQPWECGDCRGNPSSFDAARSWAIYQSGVREAIHSLKYARNLGMGEIFASKLAKLYIEQSWQADCIVPVPVSTKRRKERGYNQTELIARPLGYMLGLDVVPQAIHKAVELPSQVKLSASERRQHVLKAFVTGGQAVAGRIVLLIDDVFTTGSTLRACASVLKQAGAKQVFALTIGLAGQNVDENEAESPERIAALGQI